MKVPYVIYADFEDLVRKIHRCEHKPETKASYTEKTEQHEAYGYSYMVVRSDGEVYSLATPKPLLMTAEDWQKHKNATKCHICNKSLIKDRFLDSIPVCEHDTGSYCGQSHKGCYYFALRQMEFIGPKRERQE